MLLWDLQYDKKIKMHTHEHQIQNILFAGEDDRYLITLDGYYKVSLFVSEWESLKRITQIYLPDKQRQLPVHSVLSAYNKKSEELVIVENEQKGGYRLSVWTFRNELLDL